MGYRTLSELRKVKKSQLINILYNQEIRDLSDIEDIDGIDNGKSVPYMGWWWRDTDVVNKRITLGFDGKYIAVMENNKWGYPQRLMTEDEADTFIDYIDRAIVAGMQGGDVKEIEQARNAILKELHDWMQQLLPKSDASSY